MAQTKRTTRASVSTAAAATTRRALPLAGKVAVVTNAAQRPIWDIALELARKGAKIVATYDNPKDKPFINALVSKIASLAPPRSAFTTTTTTTKTTTPPSCLALLVDLRSPSAASSLVSQTVARFGPRVDILVNTPYEGNHNYNHNNNDDDDNKNTPASLSLPELFKPLLPESGGGGRIISITSAGARYDYNNDTDSSDSDSDSDDALVFSELSDASKETLDGMTRGWAEELRRGGHTANVVDLGAEHGEALDGVPLEDTVRLVTWLASAESGSMTGRMLSPT